MKITLRSASIDDLSLLQHWDQQPHVKASDDEDDDWNWEYELQRFPEWREQLIAELDGRPIGCVQIIDPAEEESHYWGDVEPNQRAIDIWIGGAEDLGKGYGTIMMNLALERCFADENVTSVLIDPLETNHGAIRFYERFGFELVARRAFNSSKCLVYKFDRTDWKMRN